MSDHLLISADRCSDGKSERIRIKRVNVQSKTKHQRKVWSTRKLRVGSAMCLNMVGKVSADENKIGTRWSWSHDSITLIMCLMMRYQVLASKIPFGKSKIFFIGCMLLESQG